ncbi:ORF V: Enzymatic polyprotein [Labeo rohita]|uniref:ORF V: Enzymatic polyprotein n=1 Tax=Labeo rohita TaxID=84645 RepID=A0ABQ8MTT0_LABRO|nr:ORF V: Enzymatic polyprotein [Labeo rohita]
MSGLFPPHYPRGWGSQGVRSPGGACSCGAFMPAKCHHLEEPPPSPVQSLSFLGMELNLVDMMACLTEERARSVLDCLSLFRHRTAVPLKIFQRLLGHMASAATVTTLGLFHMRPLQHWLYGQIPRWAWHRGMFRVGITPECRRLFSPWSDLAFLRAGMPLGQVSRHVIVKTFASRMGWGAVCNGQAASGSWTVPRLQWHINWLELLSVFLAMHRFRLMLRGKHVLVRTDNIAMVAYINHQGGVRSCRHLLLWRELNRAADTLSRQLTLPGEWRLHPQVVQLIWSRFGEAQVDLFASPESALCQLFYSLTEAPFGTDALAHSWPRGLLKYAFPPVSLLVQTLVHGTQNPRDSPSLEDSPEEGPSFSGDGHHLAPVPRSMEPSCVASGRDAADLSGLPQAVIDTITQSRAPSTRQAYVLRWGLFVDWCSSRREDPQRCSIGVVLSFLQEKLERRLSPSTLKVYVAVIAVYHDVVDGLPLGRHHLIVRFLRGAFRRDPFEPLESVELKYLLLKTSLLIALTSIKRVGDLHAFSVDESCLEFGPADSHVLVWLCAQGSHHSFSTTGGECASAAPRGGRPGLSVAVSCLGTLHLCGPHRNFRCSEQLFVCFGGQQKGNAVSKQRLAHWVVDAITLAYQCQGEACPLGVRAHSTRSVASSWALAHGASLADICRAASWATPHTFTRFYNLCVTQVFREDSSVSACCAIPFGSVRLSQWFPLVNSGSSVPSSSN